VIRVLLVDDSPVMRLYVSRALKMIGLEITVYEAENGRDAIGQALRIQPDIIITDLNMPEMSGEELVRRVHANRQLRGTRVLVLSADRSAGRSDELMEAGATAYLTKPVTPETLKDQLLLVLEKAC